MSRTTSAASARIKSFSNSSLELSSGSAFSCPESRRDSFSHSRSRILWLSSAFSSDSTVSWRRSRKSSLLVSSSCLCLRKAASVASNSSKDKFCHLVGRLDLFLLFDLRFKLMHQVLNVVENLNLGYWRYLWKSMLCEFGIGIYRGLL